MKTEDGTGRAVRQESGRSGGGPVEVVRGMASATNSLTDSAALAPAAAPPDLRLWPAGRWYPRAKPALEGLLALALLVLTAPLILLAMALVKLTSRGPAIYSQTRLGWRG